jgi:hypothetical protein
VCCRRAERFGWHQQNWAKERCGASKNRSANKATVIECATVNVPQMLDPRPNANKVSEAEGGEGEEGG